MTSDILNNDTICALATKAGGAIAIIRISGPQTLPITCSACRGIDSTTTANTIHFTRINNGKGEIIDEAMVSVFKAPHSYTGEDSAEIYCHGSSFIVREILNLLVDKGCRMANPGEYTMRAYLNGKMDLSQAEAVADLIASNNKATHQIAMSQMRGHFSSELSALREKLLKLTSLLELELDFSDHEDLEFADRKELLQLAQTIDEHVSRLAHSFETGQAIKQGIPVAIIGKTNVGKSTLLNQLLKEERAIVSDIHGTTRDTVEDTIDIQGVTFRFIDTAGIRETQDTIEQIGINRTYQAIEKARIVLWMMDEKPSSEEIADMTERSQGKSLIIVQNKIDLSSSAPICCDIDTNIHMIPVSAKTGENMAKLENAIYQAANIPIINDNDVIITNVRHYNVLTHALDSIHQVFAGLSSNLSGDLIAEDLKIVLADLAEITGEGQITPQETLNNIFKHFCVGK